MFFSSCVQAQEALNYEMLQEKLRIIHPDYLKENFGYIIADKNGNFVKQVKITTYNQKNIDSLMKANSPLSDIAVITVLFSHYEGGYTILSVNKKKSKPPKIKNVIKFKKQALEGLKLRIANIANVNLPILYVNNILIPPLEVREKIKNINEKEFSSVFYGKHSYVMTSFKLVAVWVKTL